MITTNFSLRRGCRRGRRRRKKILGDPDRLHKSALFKWANIIWSAALWSIIPDSYPSRERGINHGAKLFSSAPPHRLLSLYITPLIPLAQCHARFVLWFSLLVLLNAEQCFCCNHVKWLGASISVIGFRSSLELESGEKPEM